MGEAGEISVAPSEVKPSNTSSIEAATEQRNTSVEAMQADEKEIYQRGNLVIEKKISPSEKDIWPLRSIELTVSQNGQQLLMNDLLPEGWTIVEDLFATGPFVHSGINKIVLPQRVFMPAQVKEAHGLEKTEHSLMTAGENGVPEGHDFLALRGSLMALLHEIGHIDDFDQLSEEERIHNSAVRTRLSEEHTLEASLSELSDTDLRDYVDTIYRSERSAWMHAFKQYRQIKKETGIDLAEGRSATKVIQSAHTCLTTYEEDSNRVLSTYRNTTRKRQPPATTPKKVAA